MDNDYYQDCDDEEFRAIGLVLKERDTEIASLRAEIGRLREALQHIATGNRRYLANRVDSARLANGIAVIEVCAELAEAALTPPSQAPEARRDVGGERL